MTVYLGFDIGGTSIKYGLVDGEWNVLYWDRSPVDRLWGNGELLERLCSLAESALRKADDLGGQVRGIGVGTCGFVDHAGGILIGDTKLPNLADVHIKACLEERFELPVLLDHDIRVFTRNEMVLGYGRGLRDFCVIAVGTGLGVCFVFDGKVYYRSPGGLGHTLVGGPADSPDGQPIKCHCGAEGCLECYAGRDGFIREAKRVYCESPEKLALIGSLQPAEVIPELVKFADRGDTLARDVFRRGAERIADGVHNILVTLNPEKVILAGGIIDVGKYIHEPLINRLRRESYLTRIPGFCAEDRVLFSRQGKYAGIIGAAILASEYK